MKTIREIFNKSDRPDLSGWRIQELYTIEEVSLLCASIDPDTYPSVKIADAGGAINACEAIIFRRSLIDAAKCGRISLVEANIAVYDEVQIRPGEFDYVEEMPIDPSKITAAMDVSSSSTLRLEEIIKWAAHYKLELVDDHPNSPFDLSSWGGVKRPEYRTPALDMLYLLIDKFWADFSDAKPASETKKLICTQWMEKESEEKGFGLSKNFIDAIDSIARHPNRRGRGSAKINAVHVSKVEKGGN